MKTLALALALAGTSWGAGTVIAAASVTAADGSLATGTITITVTMPFTAADATYVSGVAATVEVVNGAFTVTLEPNDSGTPGNTSYRALWQLDGEAPRMQYWYVPTAVGTLGLRDVTAASYLPAPPAMVLPGQLASGGAAAGQCLVWSGTIWAPAYCGGGSGGTVYSVFGRIGAVAAQSGDYTFGEIAGTLGLGQIAQGGASTGACLEWNGTAWAPATCASGTGGGNNFTQYFTSQTSVTIPASASGASGPGLLVSCWDGSGNWIEPNTMAVDSGYDVTVTFTAAQSGQCTVNGTNATGGGSGAVASVFGRTGAVTAATGDYTFGQVGGSLALAQIAQGGASAGACLEWSGTAWAPATCATGSGAVTSVFGRTGAVTAQSGDYSYAQITGTPTIPTNTNQLTNGAGFITAAGAPVQSVFGRTGAVVAATGDYTFGQIGGAVANTQLPASVRARAIGYAFDGGGSALSAGKTGYVTVPFSCTIAAWSATVDTGTVTFGVWKAATGTAIPTAANSIVASAAPAIASGTALHSATLTGWTTAVSANDIFGFTLTAASGATVASLVLECDQ